MSNMIPRYSPAERTGRGSGTRSTSSASTAVKSFSDGGWWTKEEARLYERWATPFQRYNDIAPNNYFDYFYTGQDIRVKVDALDDNEYLPIYSLGYQIEQNKQPLYGFASYTYDAMLRGTRIISGAFSLVVTEPFLLTQQIAKSAERRAETTEAESTYALRNFSGDAGNINRYWNRTYDFNLDAGDQHLFSIHPPFNLVIKYGIQETSLISRNPNDRVEEIKKNFNENSAKFVNTNERLVDLNSARNTKILLENIELTSKSVQYDPSGDPLMETYSFLARDERIIEDSPSSSQGRELPRTGSSPEPSNSLAPGTFF